VLLYVEGSLCYCFLDKEQPAYKHLMLTFVSLAGFLCGLPVVGGRTDGSLEA